mgnify:CR=1 FL=1
MPRSLTAGFDRGGRFISPDSWAASTSTASARTLLIQAQSKFTNNTTACIRVKANGDRAVISNNSINGFLDKSSTPSFFAGFSQGINIVLPTIGPQLGNYVISHNQVNGARDDGIFFGGTSVGSPIYGVVCTGNLVDGSGRAGIYALSCKDFQINGNQIRNTTLYGIYLNTCSGMGGINNNLIQTSGNVGIITQVSDNTGLSLYVSGNTIEAPTRQGVTSGRPAAP